MKAVCDHIWRNSPLQVPTWPSLIVLVKVMGAQLKDVQVDGNLKGNLGDK